MCAGQAIRTSFSPSHRSIANPERGFYRYSATHSGNCNRLSGRELVRYREAENITLLFRHFYLNDFREQPISDVYLESIEADFDTIRRAGLKSIIRFAYTDEVNGGFEPPYGDAPKQRILQHLHQLTPLLKKHGDIIAVVQAGFIGLWGEWHYTDYFADPGDPTDVSPEQYADREEVLRAILDAVGEERKVQIRCVPMKTKLLGPAQGPGGALSASEAHKLAAKARVGFHNDCFLASQTDYGTYRWDRTAEDKAYLAEDSRFVPVGGETCNSNPPRSSCATALKELERFHWSYLNAGYHPGVLAAWQRGGCLEEIRKRLGYRFVLQEAEVARAASPGGAFDLTVRLTNTGWASPFNGREVRVVLRAEDGSAEHSIALPDDPRFWRPGESITIQASIDLPSDLPEGAYHVLLHLPDPAPALAHRPQYAIRFANSGVWESETGYNDLLSVVLLRSSSRGPLIISRNG